MNADTPQNSPDEIEARISAMLLDELSAPEEADLRRAIEGNPELAQLHERLRRAIELLREAVPQPAELAVAEDTLPRMSEKRRQKLLARFKEVPPGELSPRPSPAIPWFVPMSIAAALMALLTLGHLVTWDQFAGRKEKEVTLTASLSKRQLNGRAQEKLPPLSKVELKDESVNRSWAFDQAGKREVVGTTRALDQLAAGTTDETRPAPAKKSPALAQTAEPSSESAGNQREKQTAMELFYRKHGGAPGGLPNAPLAPDAGRAVQQSLELPVRPPATPEIGSLSPSPMARPDVADATGVGNGRTPMNSLDPIQLAQTQQRFTTGLNTVGGLVFDSKGVQPGSLPTPEGITRLPAASPAPVITLGDQPALGSAFSSRNRAGQFEGGQQLPRGEQAAGAAPFKPAELWERGVSAKSDDRDSPGRDLADLVQAGKSSSLALPITPPAAPAQQMQIDGFASAFGRENLATLTPEQARGRNSLEMQKRLEQESADFAKERASEGRSKLQPADLEKNEVAKLPLREVDSRTDRSASSPNRVGTDVDRYWYAQSAGVKEAKASHFAEALAENVPVDRGWGLNRKPAPEPQPEVLTTENAFSTFSLNVTDVSFKLAAASLEKGALPDPATVRSEEFLNAFDYRDPEPIRGLPIAFAWARAQDPYAHNRDLIRFAVQTAARGRETGRPLNLVLLLDNSGSMERADRVRIIREALIVLGGQLQPRDQISVVAFARSARLWVDALPGSQAAELAERVGNLPPEGGTNLEEALNLAYATAARHFLSEGVNRVVLLTDGAANLGDVDPESLQRKVESWRHRGIALDCFGIGWEGFNDDLLEVLSRKGDGRYGFVNKPEDVQTEFAAQLAGALQIAASDVKVQVEFNSRRVAVWRQIGYAKHQLTKEQFRDNTVDAAELAAAESGNALYVVQVDPRGIGPIGLVRVRYREADSGLYREHEWAVPYTGPAAPLDRAPASLRLAATAAAFAEWLVSSPFAGEVTPDRLLHDLQGVPAAFEPDPRPQKLEWMIRQAKSISGK